MGGDVCVLSRHGRGPKGELAAIKASATAPGSRGCAAEQSGECCDDCAQHLQPPGYFLSLFVAHGYVLAELNL